MAKKKRRACLAALFVLAAWGGTAPVSAQEGDRYIVGIKQGVALEQGREVLRSKGLEVLDEIPGMNLLLVRPAGRSLKSFSLERLRFEPAVAGVEKDFWTKWIEAAPVSLQQVPLPTLEAVREGLPAFRLRPMGAKGEAGSQEEEAQWGVRRLNAPAAWGANQGDGVKVAVVDTGVAPDHPDLKARVAGGFNALDKDKPFADDHGHGTHVSGIIAAELDGKGVVGVAPKALIYGVKVLTKEGSGSAWGIISGINWCVENKMQVINMSLGSSQSLGYLNEAVQNAIRAGVTVVAAAGNDSGAVNYPAAYPGVIAVSALDKDDAIAKFSSRGEQVAFIAPGVKVPSTVPYFHDASGYKSYSGTSMACPHVAGLAALAVGRGAQGPAAVKEALGAAAERLPNLSDPEQGAGVIDAAKLAR